MPFTTACNKWDVVLVSFPFTDFSSDKRRPALIISPDAYNNGRDVIIAFVTSQMNLVRRFGDYPIRQWRAAGFPKESMVRMKIATIDKSIIVKKLGVLSNEDQGEIEKLLVSFFTS